MDSDASSLLQSTSSHSQSVESGLIVSILAKKFLNPSHCFITPFSTCKPPSGKRSKQQVMFIEKKSYG